jgi:DNA-binding response OmpR family regulator
VTAATVLVLDDDEDTSMLLEILFRRRGWPTVVAGNLAQARSALGTYEIAALLTDVCLPDGDGSTLLAQGRPPGLLAALLMTGHGLGSADARLVCTQAGFDDYVCKPFDARALVSRIAASLAPAKAGTL